MEVQAAARAGHVSISACRALVWRGAGTTSLGHQTSCPTGFSVDAPGRSPTPVRDGPPRRCDMGPVFWLVVVALSFARSTDPASWSHNYTDPGRVEAMKLLIEAGCEALSVRGALVTPFYRL